MINSLSIIIPAYNEEALIESSLMHIQSGLESMVNRYELIIVDDGSTDATGEIIERLAAKDCRIKIVRHGKNAGKGAALISGFKTAAMDWILFTDADMQIDIAHLPDFLEHAGDSNAVIGYRKIRSDSVLRRWISAVYGRVASSLLGFRVHDAHCPFKLFNSRIIHALPLRTHGFMIDTELLYRIHRCGYEIKELPVISRASANRTSSLKLWHVGVMLGEFIAIVKLRFMRGSRR